MFSKFLKIIFLKEKKYFFLIFFSVFLSLFSYLLWLNIVSWVKNYLQEEIKPILWADIVVSSDTNIDISDVNWLLDDFYIANTIELDTTLFDWNKPILYELVFYSDLYPFYWDLSYISVDNDWIILVDESTYNIFWNTINLFDNNFDVKWVLNNLPLGEFSIYSNNKKIYIPIDNFYSYLNSNNSRLNYKLYLNFKWEYSELIANDVKKYFESKDLRATILTDRQSSIGDITDRFYIFINFFNLIIFLLTFL